MSVTKTQKTKNVLLAAAMSLLVFFIPTVAVAEEINPTPGTYSVGSTSEVSPYAAVNDVTPGASGSLVNTGEFVAGIAVVSVLLVAAGIVVVVRRKNVKFKV